jgi:hypothetical protein
MSDIRAGMLEIWRNELLHRKASSLEDRRDRILESYTLIFPFVGWWRLLHDNDRRSVCFS